ncbi:alkaline phytoceramidase [Coniochaeta sp. PMI_546]|nr:alkaline phytoceramidase [Coniochaeta sp. PMI_546]
MAHHVRHFTGDAYADAGVWSPSSSTANFCEEDYATTRYIAEFANAISNFAYVYFALRHTGWRLGHMDQLSVSLFMVGVCSFLFHATLRQSTQFSDDVSMLFLTGALLQRLYCAGQPPSRARGITIAIYASVGTMSAIYIRSGNLLVHMSMFAAMLLLIGLRTMYLINRQAASGHEKTKHIRKFGSVCAYLAVAFLLWNVDFEWCHELRSLRASIGLPWAWLLELHAWWHVLTAVGAALHMDLVRELCP